MRTPTLLVACEESQRVCTAFRDRGWEAYSCDLVDPSGGHPEWHIKGDCLPLLNKDISFTTMDGETHHVDEWDLVIAHPPCTRLCNSGQRWLYFGDQEYKEKKRKEQLQAIGFFLKIALAPVRRIAVENPAGIMSNLYRKPDFIYNPYYFEGETEQKKTCLWIKDLPPLKKTQVISREKITLNLWKGHFEKQQSWNDPETARKRSITPVGVAKAMADQWGSFVEDEIREEQSNGI